MIGGGVVTGGVVGGGVVGGGVVAGGVVVCGGVVAGGVVVCGGVVTGGVVTGGVVGNVASLTQLPMYGPGSNVPVSGSVMMAADSWRAIGPRGFITDLDNQDGECRMAEHSPIAVAGRLDIDAH